MSPEEFRTQQDEKVSKAHGEFEAAAEAIRTAREGNAPPDQIRRLVDGCHAAGRKFFRILNDEVVNYGHFQGEDFKKFQRESLQCALNVLDGLPENQRRIEELRSEFGIDKDKYTYATAAFGNMQSIVAGECPDQVDRLRKKFHAVGLPTFGFDRPLKRKEPNPSPRPTTVNHPTDSTGKFVILTLIVIIGSVMGLGSIGLSAYALYLETKGKTKLDFLGFHVSTDDGAVALFAVGVILLCLTYAKVMKKL